MNSRIALIGTDRGGSRQWALGSADTWSFMCDTEPMEGIQSPFCVNYWWLTERKLGPFTSHMIKYPWPDLYCGSADFRWRFTSGLAKKSNNGADLTSKPKTNSYFEIICLMALCILRNKQWTWSYWKLHRRATDTTNVVTGEIAVITGKDHQETLRDDCGNRPAKAGILRRARKLWWVPVGWCRAVCQEKEAIMWIPIPSRTILLRSRIVLEWKTWNLSCRLWVWRVITNQNAAAALEYFFLYMEGLDQEVDMEQVKHALQETRWLGRLELFTPGVSLDGAHAMLRLIDLPIA